MKKFVSRVLPRLKKISFFSFWMLVIAVIGLIIAWPSAEDDIPPDYTEMRLKHHTNDYFCLSFYDSLLTNQHNSLNCFLIVKPGIKEVIINIKICNLNIYNATNPTLNLLSTENIAGVGQKHNIIQLREKYEKKWSVVFNDILPMTSCKVSAAIDLTKIENGDSFRVNYDLRCDNKVDRNEVTVTYHVFYFDYPEDLKRHLAIHKMNDQWNNIDYLVWNIQVDNKQSWNFHYHILGYDPVSNNISRSQLSSAPFWKPPLDSTFLKDYGELTKEESLFSGLKVHEENKDYFKISSGVD